MTDRTPIILSCLYDQLAKDGPNGCNTALARGVMLALDLHMAAALWPPTGDDEAAARWILAGITTGHGHEKPGPYDRAVEVAVAQRFAQVACACKAGERWPQEAVALWEAAARLAGFMAVFHTVSADTLTAKRSGGTGAECSKYAEHLEPGELALEVVPSDARKWVFRLGDRGAWVSGPNDHGIYNQSVWPPGACRSRVVVARTGLTSIDEVRAALRELEGPL